MLENSAGEKKIVLFSRWDNKMYCFFQAVLSSPENCLHSGEPPAVRRTGPQSKIVNEPTGQEHDS